MVAWSPARMAPYLVCGDDDKVNNFDERPWPPEEISKVNLAFKIQTQKIYELVERNIP
jgi:hypothetical protein